MISTETKRCPDCELYLPIESFSKRKRSGCGFDTYCKSCNAKRARESYAKNREARLVKQAIWHKANRFKLAIMDAKGYARRKGHEPCDATEAEIKEAFTGYCALCGAEETKKKLHMDHCHETGTFRGWLCANCNKGLGNFRDDPEALARASEYVSPTGE